MTICWGNSSASSAKTDITVKFPISFTKTIVSITISRISASTTKDATSTWVRNVTKSQFKWYASPLLTGIYYIAIGY